MISFKEDFAPPVLTRRGTPRALEVVRARIAHTDHQKRRLDIFITAPVLARLGWLMGGKVRPAFGATDALRGVAVLSPSHSGLTLARAHRKSGTVRVSISGAPLASGLCAPVRDVSYEIGDVLRITLPPEWFVAAARLAPAQAQAAA